MSAKSDYDTSARGIALLELVKLIEALESHAAEDTMTAAHRQLLVMTIGQALHRESQVRD